MKDLNNSPIFDFFPATTSPIGFVSIPHSGEVIPPEFSKLLNDNSVARGKDVDFETRKLIDIPKLNQNGIHVLVAKVHRTCIDLNRSRDICVLAWKNNSHGENLVANLPSETLREDLTKKYYDPYYKALDTIIRNVNQSLNNQAAPVIDFHSMPSHPTDYHLKITPNQDLTRPSFCLSDLHGTSCPQAFIEDFKTYLEKDFENVKINSPYFGGHLTQYIDTLNTMNFQVETRRNLYMDETKRELIPAHLHVKNLVSEAIVKLFSKC